jgi:hypothetical protein
MSRSKGKKPKEFEKIVPKEHHDQRSMISEGIFRSYIHEFTGYNKLLAALHHLQKAESLYTASRTTASFKLEKIEDSDILEFVDDVFNAIAYAENMPDKGVICSIYFIEDCSDAESKKTRTYIFQYSAEFYEGWLSVKLPLIIGRNRNEGMDRLRFITLREDTNKELEKRLDRKAIGYYIPEVYSGRGMCVYSIVLDL